MLSQTISIPPQAAAAKSASSPSPSTATHNDASAISAHNPAQAKPGEQTPDTFAALLSRQMVDKSSPADTADAQRFPPKKTADGKSIRANHEELPSTDATAATLIAMLLVNPENRLTVVRNAGNDASADPAIEAQAGVSQVESKAENALSANGTSAKLASTAKEADPINLAAMKDTARAAPLDTDELSGARPNTPSATPGTSAGALAAAGLPAVSPPNQPLNTSDNFANTGIAAPLPSSAWPEEFAQRISWLGTQQNQVAELRLNPPDMGPIHVRLDISDNQATVLFSSPHGAVRDAIENALPKLREIMADNGIMLGNASVSDQTPRDNHSAGFMNQQANPGREFASVAVNATSSETLPDISSLLRQHNGMVDTFA